jgi:hypothetical protein
MLNSKAPSRQVLRKQKRGQQKEIERQINKEKDNFHRICYILNNLLSQEVINKIAIKTKVLKRNRKLSSHVLFSILWAGCLMESHAESILPLERMCIFIKNWFEIEIKPQSLQEKINTKNTAAFIKAIMAEVMKAELNKKLRKILKPNGSKLLFRRILFEDSTVVSLPETMKRIFKGCGGAASQAAVKFNFIIDQNSHHIVQMRLVGGSTPDSSLSGDILQSIEEEDLLIRDLGYFNLSALSKMISMKNVYYLSRLSKTVNVYLSKDCETQIDLIDYLKKKGIEKEGIDIEVFIGKTERLPVRLIAIKVPDEVKEARRKRYKAKNKKEPADDLLEWNGYTLMITNISKEKLSLNSLLIIYKARWKIELFFKNMKSHICVDRLTGHNKYRMLCLIYIKATITLVATILYSYAQLINRGGKEVSLFKFTKWLKDEGRLMRAFITSEYATLLVELENNINYLCMQNRKKDKSVWKEAEKALKYTADIKKKAWRVTEYTEDVKKAA